MPKTITNRDESSQNEVERPSAQFTVFAATQSQNMDLLGSGE
jgi:hypothetical protein